MFDGMERVEIEPPMVSVILSTYNRVHTLAESINSILCQTFTDFELIIVDDGSTDGTKELLATYTDERIKTLFLEENHFYCYAANQGLKLVRGKYIAINNSDDIWEQNKLEIQIHYMEQQEQCGACFSKVTLINEQGENIDAKCLELAGLFERNFKTRAEWMKFFFFQGNCLCHPSAVVRTSVFKRIGEHNLTYCQLADFDLWIRIVSVCNIYVIPEKLVRYRWEKDGDKQVSGATRTHRIRSFNEHMMIRRSMLERLGQQEFIDFFQEEFRNPQSSTNIELQCEKAFLLMRADIYAPYLNVLGIEKMEEILRTYPSAVTVLKNKFDFTLHDLYQMNQKHCYYDMMVKNDLEEYKKNYASAMQKIQGMEDENHKMQQRLKEYSDSTSWKYTKPLRAVAKWTKTLVGK